jgi:hypothetical protein
MAAEAEAEAKAEAKIQQKNLKTYFNLLTADS